MRSLAVAIALAVLTGCSGGGPGGTLHLSWRLVDGRDCANGGVDRVELRLRPIMPNDVAERSFACTLGLSPQSVTSEMLPGAGTLYLDGRSIPGSDLYRGTLALDSAPFVSGATATVTLYAVAAN
jgi:hypothetical protein